MEIGIEISGLVRAFTHGLISMSRQASNRLILASLKTTSSMASVIYSLWMGHLIKAIGRKE